MKTKEIVNYLDKYTFCILVPVYYYGEEKTAWRKCYVGTLEDCESNFSAFPDYFIA